MSCLPDDAPVEDALVRVKHLSQENIHKYAKYLRREDYRDVGSLREAMAHTGEWSQFDLPLRVRCNLARVVTEETDIGVGKGRIDGPASVEKVDMLKADDLRDSGVDSRKTEQDAIDSFFQYLATKHAGGSCAVVERSPQGQLGYMDQTKMEHQSSSARLPQPEFCNQRGVQGDTIFGNIDDPASVEKDDELKADDLQCVSRHVEGACAAAKRSPKGPSRCMARTKSGQQCPCFRSQKSMFCALHRRPGRAKFGRVDVSASEEKDDNLKADEFRDGGVDSRKTEQEEAHSANREFVTRHAEGQPMCITRKRKGHEFCYVPAQHSESCPMPSLPGGPIIGGIDGRAFVKKSCKSKLVDNRFNRADSRELVQLQADPVNHQLDARQVQVGGRNYYSTLGIDSSASVAEIVSAFRRCALHAHPELFHALCEALETLSDVSRRREYDRQLGLTQMCDVGMCKDRDRPAPSACMVPNVLRSALLESPRHKLEERLATLTRGDLYHLLEVLLRPEPRTSSILSNSPATPGSQAMKLIQEVRATLRHAQSSSKERERELVALVEVQLAARNRGQSCQSIQRKNADEVRCLGDPLVRRPARSRVEHAQVDRKLAAQKKRSQAPRAKRCRTMPSRGCIYEDSDANRAASKHKQSCSGDNDFLSGVQQLQALPSGSSAITGDFACQAELVGSKEGETGCRVIADEETPYLEGTNSAATSSSKLPGKTNEAREKLEEWLLHVDAKKGVLLQYLEPLLREFGSLVELAAAVTEPTQSCISVIDRVDPLVFNNLGVHSLGHKLMLAKAIIALHNSVFND